MSNWIQHTTDTTEVDGKTYYTWYWRMQCTYREEGTRRHNIYWSQLVTPGLMSFLRRHFKARWPVLVEAYKADPTTAFNEQTRIAEWDRLHPFISDAAGKLATQLEYAEYPKHLRRFELFKGPCVGKTALRMAIQEDLAQAQPEVFS